MKKILSIMLIVVMALFVVPTVSFANTTYTDWNETTKLPTAEGSYKLMNDVTITHFNQATVGAFSGSEKTVTVDLNGHKVLFDGSYAYYYVQNTGKLIIEDSVGTGLMTNSGVTNTTGYIVYTKGKFELNGGTIENTISSGVAVYVNNGDGKQASFVMNGGKVVNAYNLGARAISVANNATLTLNAGTVESAAAGTAGATPTIEGTQKTSKIIMNGGKVDSAGTAIQAANGPVEISGGTIEADYYALQTRYATVKEAEGKTIEMKAGAALLNPYSAPSTGSGNVIVSGDFDAPKLAAGSNSANVDVHGGDYTNGGNDMAGTITPAHEFSDWIVDKPATCVDPGSKYRECLCGDVETDVIDPTGVHTYVEGKCSVCEAKDPNYVPSKAPDTGDSTNVLLYSVLALLGMATTVAYARKKA